MASVLLRFGRELAWGRRETFVLKVSRNEANQDLCQSRTGWAWTEICTVGSVWQVSKDSSINKFFLCLSKWFGILNYAQAAQVLGGLGEMLLVPVSNGKTEGCKGEGLLDHFWITLLDWLRQTRKLGLGTTQFPFLYAILLPSSRSADSRRETVCRWCLQSTVISSAEGVWIADELNSHD